MNKIRTNERRKGTKEVRMGLWKYKRKETRKKERIKRGKKEWTKAKSKKKRERKEEDREVWEEEGLKKKNFSCNSASSMLSDILGAKLLGSEDANDGAKNK